MATTRSHLVFACHSKSCAPPPVGSGGSDPTRTAKFTKSLSSRNQAVKSAAERVLAESIYSGKTKVYHGSSADIQVGDVVRPTDSGGALALGGKRAFATRNLLTSKVFAGPVKNIYEVVPIKKDLQFLPSGDLGVHVASASGFRVVRKLDPSEVVVPSGKIRKRGEEHRRRQKELQEKRARRKAQIRYENDPAFKDVIDRLESILN